MKFEIKKDVLMEGLTKVARVISIKGTIPILQGILVEVKKDEISLKGSDGTESIVHCIPVDGENAMVLESGKTVLPKQAVDIVKKSKKLLSIAYNGSKTLITSGKSNFELNGLDPEEYPRFSEVNLVNPTLTLNGNQFKDFVKRTAFAASESDTRPILQGVLYSIEEDSLNLTCTDSHRLSQVTHTLEKATDVRLIIPAKSLENCMKIFDSNLDVELFTSNEQSILFRNGPTLYTTRLLEGNYPDTTRLIPNEYKSVMKINRKEFIEGLELISGIANAADNTTKGTAKLHVNGIASLSSYQAQTGKGMIEIPYSSLEGEADFTISFSVKYVIDALRAMTTDTVDFKYTDSMRPFIIAPSESVSFEELQLILPVRTY